MDTLKLFSSEEGAVEIPHWVNAMHKPKYHFMYTILLTSYAVKSVDAWKRTLFFSVRAIAVIVENDFTLYSARKNRLWIDNRIDPSSRGNFYPLRTFTCPVLYRFSIVK